MADLESTKRKWNFKDLTNLRFGKWVVLYLATTKNRSCMWLCRCDCGKESLLQTHSLVSGNTKSCGCYRIDRGGKSQSREYHQWWHAKRRCNDPLNTRYHCYGARGIKMCERWTESFENFYADMGACPDGFTLDRINNDGDYAPDNCRWATRVTQTRNRRKTLMATHNGETRSLGEWAEILNIPYDRLHDRHINGKPLFAPLHQGQGRRRQRAS